MSQTDPGKQENDPSGKDERKRSALEIRNAAKVTAQGLRLGKSRGEIIARLRQMGLTHREAEGIEDHMRLAYQYSQMRIGTMLVISGFLWLIASFVVPVLRPGPNATRYSWMIFIVAILQWLYGWQRRRRARRVRPMRGND